MMKQTLKEDLNALVCAGNVAKLPTEALNNYPELKKTLTKACGKYKKNTFEFPYPAQAVINRLMSGENIDFKKEFQFFATPSELADVVASYIIGFPEKMGEFQAGHGALIDAVLKISPQIEVQAVELSELNFEVLKKKYKGAENVKITQGDFMTMDIKEKFPLIVANPPFTKSQDIDHVLKMYGLLGDGGRLITIMSKSWTFESQKKQKDFKQWIEDVEALVVENGQGAFKTSGTGVNSVLVVIDK
jgi:hypothetical protein